MKNKSLIDILNNISIGTGLACEHELDNSDAKPETISSNILFNERNCLVIKEKSHFDQYFGKV